MDNSDLPENKRTLYNLGGTKSFTCPLRSIKTPFVQRALELFAFFEKGITPHGDLTKETALYRNAMSTLQILKDEAASWYQTEMDRRNKHKKAHTQ